MAVDVKDIDIDLSKVDIILDRYGKQQRGLMNSLLEIQNEFHYLPSDALRHVSERMEVPLIQVYQVASFYKAFSLKPRGAHVITVCLGTACHVRGGERLLDQIERLLDIKAGETTKDLQFTLEAVNCLGVCALGPVMVLDGKYYGSMAASKVEKVLEKLTKKEVPANG
jgi:NADH-quinone oxidoreductase subunit E